jgi:hypothetical protein
MSMFLYPCLHFHVSISMPSSPRLHVDVSMVTSQFLCFMSMFPCPCLNAHVSLSVSPCPCLCDHISVSLFHAYVSVSIFHDHVSKSMSPCPCAYVHVSMSKSPCPRLHFYVSMSMSPCLRLHDHVSVSMSLCPCHHVHVHYVQKYFTKSGDTYHCIENTGTFYIYNFNEVPALLSEFRGIVSHGISWNSADEKLIQKNSDFRRIPEIQFRGHPNQSATTQSSGKEIYIFSNLYLI